MVVSEIRLFQIAKEKFGEKTAEEFVTAIKQTVDEKFNEQKGIFLTKDDKVEIIERIEASRSELIKWMFIFTIGLFFSLGGLTIGLFSIFMK